MGMGISCTFIIEHKNLITMPIDYTKYPTNWKTEIVPRILERAKNHCEQCGVGNHRIIQRHDDNPAVFEYLDAGSAEYAIRPGKYPQADLEYYQYCYDFQKKDTFSMVSLKQRRPILVVLTIAHMDNQLTDHSDKNLKALCQRCHLTHDQFMRKLQESEK